MDGLIFFDGVGFDQRLVRFMNDRVLDGEDRDKTGFWHGAAAVFSSLTDENRALLGERDRLQQTLDAWHSEHRGDAVDTAAYRTFLLDIGYLTPPPAPFAISTMSVDPEIATMAGPQLVVPVLNARFLLNAANARWGSLYDALYGTDAIGTPAPSGHYDKARGKAVIAWAKSFLDRTIALSEGSWASWRGGDLPMANPAQLIGRAGDRLLLRHNGLHIEVVIDRDHLIGRDDPAGIADVLLESALTTIIDFEDSVAAVDVEDKLAGYSNWLGLMDGDLEARFAKGRDTIIRTLNGDRAYLAPDGSTVTVPGRSLLLVRNVGHLMTTSAVRLADGTEGPEGILDAIVTSAIAKRNLAGQTRHRNGREGSIYIVKPKMHGPAEVRFANRLFDAVEDLLALPRNTLKMGVMDEERRTSTNLAACIYEARHRLIFINTGFLDRTGDEIHSAMRAGPMLRKADMRLSDWMTAYERRNVRIGLACGLSGRAQIGKGMWAAPDRMADMLSQKIAHPRSGANTAWVPSPTAATLHATHYHEVNPFDVQAQLPEEEADSLDQLLHIPLAPTPPAWTAAQIAEELDNNAQGILGYVVRWIDQGVGCSKVPDIDDVGLMEDRATLRISSQHMANWLLHGVCSREDVDAAFDRMARKVDEQNAGEPGYTPLLSEEGGTIAYRAARALVLEGIAQPNGYTEPLLHAYRIATKALAPG